MAARRTADRQASIVESTPAAARRGFAGRSLIALSLVFAIVAILTYRRVDTVRSCVGEAAIHASKDRLRNGTLTATQVLAAYLCNLSPPQAPARNAEAVHEAVAKLFRPPLRQDLVALIDPKTRGSAFAHLMAAHGPDAAQVDTAVGELLFLIDPNRALEAYKNAVSLNPSDAASLNRIAQILYNQNKFSESAAIYHRILSSNSISQRLRGSVLNNLANTYFSLGNYSKAKSAYVSAIDIDTKLGARLAVARASSNLAQIDYAEFKKSRNPALLAQARRLTNETTAVFEALHETDDIAEAEQQLAAIDALENQLQSARTHAERALLLFHQVGDAVGIAIGEGQVGSIDLALHDLAAAESAFKAEHQQGEASKMPDNIAEAWAGLAGVSVARGASGAGCRLYRESFAVWKSAGLNTEATDDARTAARVAGCHAD